MKNLLSIPLFIFAVGLFLSSCSGEDKLINEYQASYSFIFSSAANSLQKIDSDSETIVNITPENLTFDSVSIIKKFREHYYLLAPKDKKIIVLAEKTFQLIAEIDYSTLNLEPTDICFPNATDAYVTHSNDSCITILDLTNNKISGIKIKVDGNPVGIAGSGNQVHTAIPNSNQVAIIDTRTNKVEATISISDVPTYIDFTEDGLKSVVVSVGNGKTESTSGTKSPAKITVIDVIKENIFSEFQLGNNNDASLNIKPTSIIVSSRFAYISSINLANTANNTVWRVPATTFRSAINMSRTNSSFIGYSKSKNVVYFVENTETKQQLLLLDGTSNSRIKILDLPNLPTAILME